VPQLTRATDLAILDFADQAWLDPAHRDDVLAWLRFGERVRRPLQRLQHCEQIGALRHGQARADVADAHQVPGGRVVRAEQQSSQ
jgi:hypothetical protein